MNILVSGGGTGGHITPIRSIAHDVKQLSADVHITYVGERNGRFAHMLHDPKLIDKTYGIFSGKYRRYHGESIMRKLLDVRTIALNLRDFFFVIIGFMQCLYILGAHRPNVVFLKGGYVGVPVGLVAWLYRIPIVTHDSDAVAGLANRVVSRGVVLHATALPADRYPYPPGKTMQTGVIVSNEYTYVDEKTKQALRNELALPTEAKVLFITGGSSGAVAINRAFVSIVEAVLALDQDVYVIHQVGKGKQAVYKNIDNNRLEVHEFIDGIYKYSGAADVIVTRAGANTLAEFAVQAKPCVVIPSPHLAGGHQLENASYLQQREAAIILQEAEMKKDPRTLLKAIEKLILSPKEQKRYASCIQDIAQTNASEALAKELLKFDTNKNNNT